MKSDFIDEVAASTGLGLLHTLISDCKARYANGSLQDYDFVAIFILACASLLRPGRWCNGAISPVLEDAGKTSETISSFPLLLDLLNGDYLKKKLSKICSDIELSSISVMSLISRLQLCGIKGNKDNCVNRAILAWAAGVYRFRLLFYVPSPMEVLRQQAVGERVITLFTTKQELMTSHVAKLYYMDGMHNHSKDAFEFLLHDISHMRNFMSLDCHDEQVGFFRCVLQLECGRPKRFFTGTCGYDCQLWHELEYAISDMNCFLPHLLHYVLAKMLLATERQIATSACSSSYSLPSSFSHKVRVRLERNWQAMLGLFGMSSVLCDSASPPLSSPYQGRDEESNVEGMRSRMSAYAVCMGMIATTYKERGPMTPEEGTVLRDFFKEKASESFSLECSVV